MPTQRTVVYVDLGYHTAREVWHEVGLPAYERFTCAPTRATAMDAAVHAWHIHDWIWHEDNPGIDPLGNADFTAFRKQLFNDCPELEWVRDIAEATKHRGLGRRDPPKVQELNPPVRGKLMKLASGGVLRIAGGKLLRFADVPLTIGLPDGNKHEVAEVLKRVVEFWQGRFATVSPPSPEQPT